MVLTSLCLTHLPDPPHLQRHARHRAHLDHSRITHRHSATDISWHRPCNDSRHCRSWSRPGAKTDLLGVFEGPAYYPPGRKKTPFPLRSWNDIFPCRAVLDSRSRLDGRSENHGGSRNQQSPPRTTNTSEEIWYSAAPPLSSEANLGSTFQNSWAIAATARARDHPSQSRPTS